MCVSIQDGAHESPKTQLDSSATALAVIVAPYQIRIARLEAVSRFEDRFANEYREVASRIPARAPLGVELSEDEKTKHFDELFFRYFDLLNEQIFLRQATAASLKVVPCFLRLP